MTIAIDPSVGGQNANSFVTEAEAIALASVRTNLVGWVTVSGTVCTEDEKKFLIGATEWISTLTYQGFRTDPTQAQAWPRLSAQNPDDAFCTFYDLTVIPARIKKATCELAFEFAKAGSTDIAAIDDKIAVTREVIGPIETDYAAPSQRAQGLLRFPRVMRYLSPLLGIGAGQVRLTR